MKHNDLHSRREFIARSAALGIGFASSSCLAAEVAAADATKKIKDPEIRAGVEAAIQKNILPAVVETAYTGYFYITANGGSYGGDATWPGLDSWQMAGALLLLGRARVVHDYFDYVKASQRKDGNIPFAIFPERKPESTCLRGLKWPDDVFSYAPPKRDGVPAPGQQTRKWIGLFEHWQTVGEPLSTLGPVCYILTAHEIFHAMLATDRDKAIAWLRERSDSLDAAGQYLWSRRTDDGLIGASGFYSEAPPRDKWDGVTQCYVIRALEQLEDLHTATDAKPGDGVLATRRKELTKAFLEKFWRDDHFVEYIHPKHGVVDLHGLSDVNWAAVAFGVATDDQIKVLWPKLMAAKEFWFGEMPTQSVTKPFAYEPWEQNFNPPCAVPPLADVAAMGRVWYLEAMACKRMKAYDRLTESVKKVCRMAKDGFWRERYHPQKDGPCRRTERSSIASIRRCSPAWCSARRKCSALRDAY